MALSASRWALIAVLVAAAIYFLVFHTDPLPLNHEAIGLGTLHLAHDAIGVVLLAVAGVFWWSARKASAIQAGT